MKKKVSVIATVMFFLSLATIVTVSLLSRSRVTIASEKERHSTYSGEAPPYGAWSLMCSPSLTRQTIVDAYSVTSERGDTITKVALKNRSNRDVISVKLGWRLFYYDSPEHTLMSGESSFLGVPLNVKERRVVEFPMVSFAEVSKSLLKNGRIDGDFKIEVVVTDVLFKDNEEKSAQSSWRKSLPASFLPPASLSSTKGPIVEAVSRTAYPTVEGCSDQGCRASNGGFICQPETGSNCKVADSSSCTTTICDIID